MFISLGECVKAKEHLEKVLAITIEIGRKGRRHATEVSEFFVDIKRNMSRLKNITRRHL